MRWHWALALAALPAVGASTPVPVAAVPIAAVPLGRALAIALQEQRSAEAGAARLQQSANRARNSAERLGVQQVAAAQSIAAAEAEITAADVRLRLVSAQVALNRARLAQEQRPAAELIAGLALMARQPPLLALAQQSSADELVRVRVLIDTTLPVLRARTGRLSGQLAQGRRFEQAALAARRQLNASRSTLIARRVDFARLEQRALAEAAAATRQSLGVGDTALAASEDVMRLRAEQPGARAAYALAVELAAESIAPAGPPTASERAPGPPFAYALPAAADVTEGLGAISASGVRSRGLTLATRRGAPVAAPAAGTVRYAGPFREFDGVIIVDHGGGWLTLVVNAAPDVARGERIVAGQPLGRALGPIQVELSRHGRSYSPALIAGSYLHLSNGRQGG